MQGRFVNIRLDTQTSEKLNYLSRKTLRSRGLTMRFLVDLGYRLLKTNPELFIIPDGDIQDVLTNGRRNDQ